MTKKQIAALKRIVDREIFRNNKDKRFIPAGAHPCDDGYVVTDGYVAILFPDKPEGLSVAERITHIGKMIKDECRNGNHVLIDSKFPLDEWKRFARQEEKQGVQPRVTIGDDIIVDGFGLTTDFNPRLVIDAMEAIGAGAMAYIGGVKGRSHNTLLIYPKDWMDDPDNCPVAFVLPLRRKT